MQRVGYRTCEEEYLDSCWVDWVELSKEKQIETDYESRGWSVTDNFRGSGSLSDLQPVQL